MQQLDFLSTHACAPAHDEPAEPTLEERFRSFHQANPHVLVAMLRLARERVARGATRIGAKSLWEQLRETLRVEKQGEYKLNNSFTSFYSRLLIETAPDLETYIETRKLAKERSPRP